jgi:hypothetical protein
MAAVPVTPEGLAVRKRFVVSDLTLPRTPPTLRVPVLMQPGTRFEARVEAGGSSYDTASMTVEQDGGRQRLVFRLDRLPQPEAAAEVVLHLRLVDGEMAILADSLRWYGRSAYAAGTTPQDIRAEAAVEVEWLKSAAELALPPSP